MALKWTADKVIKEIQRQAVDGVVTATGNSALYHAALRFYRTWDRACELAGVRPIGTVGKRPRTTRLADVSAGIKTEAPIRQSLCWTCAKSGADLDTRCSWDAALILPAGAVYQEIQLSSVWSAYKISYCPEYERLADLTRGYGDYTGSGLV